MHLAGRAKWLFNYISNSCLLIFFWFLAWKYKIMSCFCEMFERQKYGKALFLGGAIVKVSHSLNPPRWYE